MTLPSTQPRPCTDSNCRGQHAPAERVALAMSLCSARGVQLTELRRQILELLWESGRPTGAYELIEALKLRGSRPVGPPTVYRALEFLMSQGLVSKIESRNAYVPCAHLERRHDCLFFFLKLRPSRLRKRQIVSRLTAIPAAASSSRSRSMVGCGVSPTSL